MKNLKLVARETKKGTVVDVSGVEVGRDFVVIAGPCSVESEKQILETAHAVKAAGAELSHLPIIIDPTHSTGRISLIASMSMAAVAAGADGMIVEVHHKPQEALCDADQALTPDMFDDMMNRLRPLQSFLNSQPAASTAK
jgi:3-deoxy-D-arabino-heptulosonate 7-phosphate (DAHP) synthase